MGLTETSPTAYLGRVALGDEEMLFNSKSERGKLMLEVTEKATGKLKEYFAEQQIQSPIRIFVSHIG